MKNPSKAFKLFAEDKIPIEIAIALDEPGACTVNVSRILGTNRQI
jgi:hypothetical protein